METLERRFGHIFPPDIMHLFKVNRRLTEKILFSPLYLKNTVRIYSNDRLTSEMCIQHDAFISLNLRRSQRHHRPYNITQIIIFISFDNFRKSTHSSLSTSQLDPTHETIHQTNPLSVHRLSKS